MFTSRSTRAKCPRATGKLAKTDSLDAAAIAHFAEAVRPPVRPLRDAETQALNSLAARRHQVMTMLVSEKNRLGTATVARVTRDNLHGIAIALLDDETRDGIMLLNGLATRGRGT